jgi:hypothetical protein
MQFLRFFSFQSDQRAMILDSEGMQQSAINEANGMKQVDLTGFFAPCINHLFRRLFFVPKGMRAFFHFSLEK